MINFERLAARVRMVVEDGDPVGFAFRDEDGNGLDIPDVLSAIILELDEQRDRLARLESER